jgi:hypothetical protein
VEYLHVITCRCREINIRTCINLSIHPSMHPSIYLYLFLYSSFTCIRAHNCEAHSETQNLWGPFSNLGEPNDGHFLPCGNIGNIYERHDNTCFHTPKPRFLQSTYGGFLKWGIPLVAGWFTMEKPIKLTYSDPARGYQLSISQIPSGILTRTLKIEKMYARTMLVVFLTFSSFGSVHVSVTHVTSPLTWTLKQAFLNSIQLTWTP